MGWGHKAIEIRAAETGHLDGVFMHKKAQKLKFLCERNDKVCYLDLMFRLCSDMIGVHIMVFGQAQDKLVEHQAAPRLLISANHKALAQIR